LGGKVTLIKSVLCVIPLYWMTFFRIPIKIRNRIEKLCRRFLWFGGSKVRKKSYSLISWKTICQSKEQGDLGVMNLKIMNKSLLCNESQNNE
jgi:hypothetical protein